MDKARLLFFPALLVLMFAGAVTLTTRQYLFVILALIAIVLGLSAVQKKMEDTP